MADKATFPRVPELNWWVIRQQFTKTLPGAVTPSYLMSLLKLTSEGAAKNLLPPLKQLGLIDEEGKPTSWANDWRSDAKYDEVCRQMVEEVYPSELRDLYSGPNINRDACVEWFMHTAQLGRGAASQSAAMYILLNTPLHDAFNPSKTVAKTGTTTKAKVRDNFKENSTKALSGTERNIMPQEVGQVQPKEPFRNQPSIHIDLQIHISPDADAVQIDNIFSSIAKHLYNR